MKMRDRRCACLALAGVLWVVALNVLAGAPEPLALVDPAQSLGGWTFDNGREFPGAKGRLELSREEGQATLVLHGDFSNGGAYVQAARAFSPTAIDLVEFEVKVPAGVGKLTTRLIDGTRQCHQLDLRLSDKGGWQKYVFPVARYFESVASGAPMDIVTRYEKWGGANDGKWHQPASLLVFLAGRDQMSEGSIAIRNVILHSSPPTTEVPATLQLDEATQGTAPWGYNNGDEFPGAKGGLDRVAGPTEGSQALALRADFTGGGGYVGMTRKIDSDGVIRTGVFHLKARTDTAGEISLRLIDETGQCHQRGGIKLKTDGQWHELAFDPREFASGEHWGGANDGQWHGNFDSLEIILSKHSAKSGVSRLEVADPAISVFIEARESRHAWREDFEAGLPEGWAVTGDVAVAASDAGSAGHALRLARTLAQLRQETSVTGARFPVSGGAWKLDWRWRSKLVSPDNSYNVAATLRLWSRDGRALDSVPLGIRHGEADWASESLTASLPSDATEAAWSFTLNKTHGETWIDDLSATRLEVQPIAPRVERIHITSRALGNLFFPGDAVEFRLAVQTRKPLPAGDRVLRYSVSDYWGAEVIAPGEVALSPGKPNTYEATLTLPAGELRPGQFHELHVAVPEEFGAVAAEFSGFAILPPAEAKQFAPARIPFTIRNWDNRIPDYFKLADRLGLRQLGVWGGWSDKPPYEPHCPGVELCEQLGASWVTTTPAATVEREGFKTVTEEMLREGMTHFLEAYARRGLGMIAQGNEPHGTGQVVLDNVRAYKAIYESVKAFDPAIPVIGTSVEPNEEYFKAGYQNYLDAYDFHIYEHYSHVRQTMREYRDLMRKYDAVKPIHSTELGLNSQGQARLTVADELVKKCAVFFAEGGSTVSWFTIQYPDPKGDARGQFGDAHCVFDCKFNHYNPKLDAIAYYDMINGIGAKKFIGEKQYDQGAQAYLFRDEQDRCLQILWADNARLDAQVPLPDGLPVELVRIDGRRTPLTSRAGGVTVTISSEPILLSYTDGSAQLADTLEPATVLLGQEVARVEPGATVRLRFHRADGSKADLIPELPYGWQGRVEGDQLVLTAPVTTAARTAMIPVEQKEAGVTIGSLSVPVELVR